MFVNFGRKEGRVGWKGEGMEGHRFVTINQGLLYILTVEHPAQS